MKVEITQSIEYQIYENTLVTTSNYTDEIPIGIVCRIPFTADKKEIWAVKWLNINSEMKRYFKLRELIDNEKLIYLTGFKITLENEMIGYINE